MSTLLVGDVHGCAEELERLLDKVRPRRAILLGDLFTKGPDPRGVWSLIHGRRLEAVLGNQDEEVLHQWKPGRELPRKAFDWLADRPHLLYGRTWIAVHAGVRPDAWRKTPRRLATRIETWRGRPWWRAYEGKRLVVHGHHSRRGLLDHRPHTLGLDTGCVKGGRLTGYVVEEDALVSVRSRR